MQSVITMRCLGKHGRFGNAILQYMFGKLFARQHNLIAQFPEWLGTQLFTGTEADPPISAKLPSITEKDIHGEYDTIIPNMSPPPKNVDLVGYFAYHTRYAAEHKDYVRSLFQLRPAIAERMQGPAAKLRSLGRTIIGLHLRRGDYGRGMFYITPVQWYLDWLQINWKAFDTPVLYISTETPALINEFAQYNPYTAERLGINFNDKPVKNYNYLKHDLVVKDPRQLDFFPEWELLRYCDVVLMPNSTYSFVAALLSYQEPLCYRSCLPTQKFIYVDPWNAMPLCFYETVENYPGIPGTKLDSNPYW